jgi:hypothetical protein
MMIDPDHNRLSIRRQCELVSISRASFYRQPAGECPENLELIRIIDEAFMEMPWYGSACSQARATLYETCHCQRQKSCKESGDATQGHLRPSGVCQHESFHPKLESQSGPDENPNIDRA